MTTTPSIPILPVIDFTTTSESPFARRIITEENVPTSSNSTSFKSYNECLEEQYESHLDFSSKRKGYTSISSKSNTKARLSTIPPELKLLIAQWCYRLDRLELENLNRTPGRAHLSPKENHRQDVNKTEDDRRNEEVLEDELEDGMCQLIRQHMGLVGMGVGTRGAFRLRSEQSVPRNESTSKTASSKVTKARNLDLQQRYDKKSHHSLKRRHKNNEFSKLFSFSSSEMESGRKQRYGLTKRLIMPVMPRLMMLRLVNKDWENMTREWFWRDITFRVQPYHNHLDFFLDKLLLSRQFSSTPPQSEPSQNRIPVKSLTFGLQAIHEPWALQDRFLATPPPLTTSAIAHIILTILGLDLITSEFTDFDSTNCSLELNLLMRVLPHPDTIFPILPIQPFILSTILRSLRLEPPVRARISEITPVLELLATSNDNGGKLEELELSFVGAHDEHQKDDYDTSAKRFWGSIRSLIINGRLRVLEFFDCPAVEDRSWWYLASTGSVSTYDPVQFRSSSRSTTPEPQDGQDKIGRGLETLRINYCHRAGMLGVARLVASLNSLRRPPSDPTSFQPSRESTFERSLKSLAVGPSEYDSTTSSSLSSSRHLTEPPFLAEDSPPALASSIDAIPLCQSMALDPSSLPLLPLALPSLRFIRLIGTSSLSWAGKYINEESLSSIQGMECVDWVAVLDSDLDHEPWHETPMPLDNSQMSRLWWALVPWDRLLPNLKSLYLQGVITNPDLDLDLNDNATSSNISEAQQGTSILHNLGEFIKQSIEDANNYSRRGTSKPRYRVNVRYIDEVQKAEMDEFEKAKNEAQKLREFQKIQKYKYMQSANKRKLKDRAPKDGGDYGASPFIAKGKQKKTNDSGFWVMNKDLSRWKQRVMVNDLWDWDGVEVGE